MEEEHRTLRYPGPSAKATRSVHLLSTACPATFQVAKCGIGPGCVPS